jgi:hypothetical protein
MLDVLAPAARTVHALSTACVPSSSFLRRRLFSPQQCARYVVQVLAQSESSDHATRSGQKATSAHSGHATTTSLAASSGHATVNGHATSSGHAASSVSSRGEWSVASRERARRLHVEAIDNLFPEGMAPWLFADPLKNE